MIRIIDWLASLFAWGLVWDSGVWRYHENRVTGDRCAVWLGNGYQLLDLAFLEGARGKAWADGRNGTVVVKRERG